MRFSLKFSLRDRKLPQNCPKGGFTPSLSFTSKERDFGALGTQLATDHKGKKKQHFPNYGGESPRKDNILRSGT